MIELYLDDMRLDVPQDVSIGLHIGIADYTDPISASGAYTQTIDVPRTPHNDTIFMFAGEPLAADMFNHAEHTACIVEDGCELISGRAFLESTTRQAYRMQIVGAEVGWVEKMRGKKMTEIEGKAIGTYRPDDWGEILADDAVAEHYPALSFVLMHHGHWYQDTDDKPIRRSWVTYNDLIPIAKLHTILEHCFAGYTIVASDALRKALHQTYTTMAWKANDKARLLAEDMDFELTSNLLHAGDNGEVTATIYGDNYNIVALPIFDTIEADDNGVIAEGSSASGPILLFSPTTQTVAMSLELETKYQSVVAFDSVDVFDNNVSWPNVATNDGMFADQIFAAADDTWPMVQFSVQDSQEWASKEEIKDSVRVVKAVDTWVGDADFETKISPNNMPLMIIEVDNPERYESIGYVVKFGYDYTTPENRTEFYRPSRLGVSHTNVVRTNLCIGGGKNDTSLCVYPALRGYDGRIYCPNLTYSWQVAELNVTRINSIHCHLLNTEHRLTFNVAMRTPVKEWSGTSANRMLTTLYFGSSSIVGTSNSITISATSGGSLKPNFDWGVPIHGSITLADVGGDTTAEDMVRSIMQLYNLVIYTNPKTRQVHLYTFAEFWNGTIVDWRDRIDIDSDISISAMGDEIGKSVMLRYGDGNARIEYYDDRHSTPYYAFHRELSTKVSDTDMEVANTLFSPAYMVDVARELGGGSGRIPAVAEKGKEGNVLDFNLADVPHTLVMIPQGGETADYARLPLRTDVFGDIGPIQPPMSANIDGIATLSFADTAGIEGLHKHYDKQIALWEGARRMTCYCRVEAWEVEGIRHLDDNINLRALFRLNINGEDIYARLESIEYEPSNTTNKCVFIIE